MSRPRTRTTRARPAVATRAKARPHPSGTPPSSTSTSLRRATWIAAVCFLATTTVTVVIHLGAEDDARPYVEDGRAVEFTSGTWFGVGAMLVTLSLVAVLEFRRTRHLPDHSPVRHRSWWVLVTYTTVSLLSKYRDPSWIPRDRGPREAVVLAPYWTALCLTAAYVVVFLVPFFDRILLGPVSFGAAISSVLVMCALMLFPVVAGIALVVSAPVRWLWRLGVHAVGRFRP